MSAPMKVIRHRKLFLGVLWGWLHFDSNEIRDQTDGQTLWGQQTAQLSIKPQSVWPKQHSLLPTFHCRLPKLPIWTVLSSWPFQGPPKCKFPRDYLVLPGHRLQLDPGLLWRGSVWWDPRTGNAWVPRSVPSKQDLGTQAQDQSKAQEVRLAGETLPLKLIS